MQFLLKQKTILPGFGLSLGVSVFCLSILVLLPFAMLFWVTSGMGWDAFISTITEERVMAAIFLTLRLSLYATFTNLFFGTLVAWVLVRYQFPGKSLMNALVDLPFALPTAVTGIALATLYSPNGWLGQFFEQRIAFTPTGIYLALVVVSMPFIVRAV